MQEHSSSAFEGGHMTVDTALAHSRPPDNDPRFTDTGEESSPSSFHDYAKVLGLPDTTASSLNPEKMALTNKQQRKQQLATVTPIVIIPEHSLVYDIAGTSTSPVGSLMYEVDPMETNKAILSPCTSESLHSPMSLSSSFKRDAFDQPMQMEEESINLSDCDAMTLWGQDGPAIQEYLTDIINGTDGSTIKDIGDELVALTTSNFVKTEEQLDNCCGLSQKLKGDPLQMGLKDSESQGPTLAELNDRESVLDIVLPAAITRPSQSWSNDSVITTRPSCGGTLSLTDSSSSTIGTPNWSVSYPSNSSSGNLGQPLNPGQPAVSGRVARTTLATGRPGTSPAINDLQVSDLRDKRAKIALFTTQSFEQVPMQLPSTSKSSTIQAPELQTAGSLQQLLSGIEKTPNEAKTPKDETLPNGGQPPKQKRKTSTSTSSNGGKAPGNGAVSMERKWEEIRSYIDSNIKMQEEQLLKRQAAERASNGPPLKKIKVEPQESLEADTVDVFADGRDEMDSDFDQSEDDFSDVESDASYGSFVEDLLHGNKKEKKFFWQYNTQSKGPKGKRLCKSMQERDPHSLADFEDPVFQPDVNDARYKHNGKARKGDGNDITPSPWKLFQIGNELQKLNKKINCISALERPTKAKDGVKSKSRKEKNKFASRACRLKKKAQHEANKLKLFGLEQEHHQLIEVLKTIKQNIFSHVKDNTLIEGGPSFSLMLENEIKQNLTVMIAGNTADYVNTILQKVAEGDKKGGIVIHRD